MRLIELGEKSCSTGVASPREEEEVGSVGAAPRLAAVLWWLQLSAQR